MTDKFIFERDFYDKSLNKKCKLYIVKNNKSEQIFSNFLQSYLSKNIKRIIGFDIEFNTPPKSVNQREIAIIQLCFYLANYNLIIFYNPKLVSSITNDIMHELLIDKNIKKIGHGTDSLDIPALYKYLGTAEKCIKFTNTLYDTRFLCEYMNIITQDKLCNIYYLLEKFNVVESEQMKWLIENETKLGHFWQSIIDITDLSEELRDYSMYDALYLKKLLLKMRDYMNKSDKKQYDFKLVVQATRLTFLIKRKMIIIEDYSYMNICFLENKIKLYDKFINKYNKFIEYCDIEISALFALGFFKNIFIKILQLKYYLLLAKKNKIYRSNVKILSNADIDNLNNIWNTLYKHLVDYPKIIKLINLFVL